MGEICRGSFGFSHEHSAKESESLRHGFMDQSGKHNTAIHEFIHLIDKTDGAVDGIPEALVSKQYVLP